MYRWLNANNRSFASIIYGMNYSMCCRVNIIGGQTLSSPQRNNPSCVCVCI